MKLSDGLFHRVFEEIAQEYPELRAEHQIIDIGAARMAAQPETFDVIVTLNLYGDILSDIAAQVAGSIGLAGSANIGADAAMFEAVHGSAPDIAGRDVANPSGLIVAATQMLVHTGYPEIAQQVKNAWLCTLEDGIHTADVFREGLSHVKVGTQAFANAVIARLGRTPAQLEPVQYHRADITVRDSQAVAPTKELVGVDVFLHWDESNRDPETLGRRLAAVATDLLRLHLITNRGVRVFPDGLPETFRTDHWRCRFMAAHKPIDWRNIIELLQRIDSEGLEIIKLENLYSFGGEPGFSLGQGE